MKLTLLLIAVLAGLPGHAVEFKYHLDRTHLHALPSSYLGALGAATRLFESEQLDQFNSAVADPPIEITVTTRHLFDLQWYVAGREGHYPEQVLAYTTANALGLNQINLVIDEVAFDHRGLKRDAEMEVFVTLLYIFHVLVPEERALENERLTFSVDRAHAEKFRRMRKFREVITSLWNADMTAFTPAQRGYLSRLELNLLEYLEREDCMTVLIGAQK